MTAMWLKRYPSPSGGIALGKMGVGAKMLKQGKTARDYVQNGLVAMWDGIENAGWGTHSNTISTWYDLIGNIPISKAMCVDGKAVDFTANNTGSFGNTAVKSAITSGTMSLEIASLTQSNISVAQFFERTHNGGDSWTTGIILTPGSMGYYGRNYTPPAESRSASTTRVIRTDGTNVDIYIGGILYYRGAEPETHISEGRVLFYPGVRLCCIRLYSRALTADEIAHNYKIDKERFNLP